MELNFPAYNFKLKTEQNVNYVFDIIRKKFVILTPEEWVRQHLLHFLVNERSYPASLLSVERALTVNELRKRFDVLAFNNSGSPVLLVECKSPDIALGESAFMQAAVYNSRFRTRNLLITNGITHLHCKYDGQFRPTLIPGIPFYSDL